MGWCTHHRVWWSLAVIWLLCGFSTVHAATAPTFQGPTSVTMDENAAVSYTVATLSATDDLTALGNLVFTLLTSPSVFEIVDRELKVKTAIDLDVAPGGLSKDYALDVRVEDEESLTVDAVVTVTVTNVNDETPIIAVTSATATVPEGLSADTSVTFAGLGATDKDKATAGFETLAYSLEGTDSTSFKIDPSTGAITTAVVLDRETKAVYNQLVFKVTDSATPTANTATVSLTVSVLDINDVTPSCTPSIYYVTVYENTAAGTALTTLTCTDTDDGVNGDFSATVTGTVFAFSGLELQTGSTATDYETAVSHTLNVELVDTPVGGTPNTGTAIIKVTVKALNDNNPSWATWTPNTAVSSGVSIPEDAAIGTTLFTASATDADVSVGGSITYSLDSFVDNTGISAVGVFTINSVSGQVSTLQTLDRDGGITSYTITVKADDGGGSPITQAATVTLDNVNDNAPVFDSPTYQATIVESSATAGASLVQVSASDADPSTTLTFSIGAVEEGNAIGNFRFSGSTSGLLELASALDLDAGVEDATVTRLEILVKDGGTPTERTGTATVFVTVTPTNDHDPVFGATVPSTSPLPLSESIAIDTSVAKVTATDDDRVTYGDLTYTITGGNTNNAFTIVGNTGEIRTQAALDYETTTDYDLVVTVADDGSPAKTDTVSVSISVTNENDNAPDCLSVVFVSVNENALVNDPVTTLSCTDADGSTLTYSSVSGNADGKFSLDTGTGAVALAQTVDYDSATQSYSLQFTASDGATSQTIKVQVTLNPINEHTPSFATNPTETVSEAEVAGFLVMTYTATDDDYSPHDITTYAITAVTQSGSSKFQIDQSTGAITLRTPLDYEALPTGTKQYELTVTATDGGGLVDSGTVTVVVTDANDNAPTCSQTSWSTQVNEDTASFPHTVVASLGCTDADSGTTLSYTLTENPSGTLFSETSGGIELTGAVDYETSTFHDITVVVTDNGTPPLSSMVVVNVFVQDVNDGPPTFSGPFDVTKAEDLATAGAFIADVTASDPDGANSEFGKLQYSIISGDPNDQFLIDATSGKVTTRKDLDADTTQTHKIVIQAIEDERANSATVTLTVTLTDVNDIEPSCAPSSHTVQVHEPAAVGDTVVTLTCTDGDVTVSALTYQITSGDTPATFAAMTSPDLKLSSTLDYDAGTTQYSLTITVSDGTNTVEVPVTVTVLPVDETPPVFSPNTYNVQRSENLAVGGTIDTVTASDADSADTADGQVSYEITPYSSAFNIDQTTGVITLLSSLDRETQSTHDIVVTARDVARSASVTVSLTVLDENDNPPVFTAATYTGSVSETDGTGTTVVTVAANDIDDSVNDNNVVVYSITAGDTNGDFTIDSSTGEISVAKALNAGTTHSYALIVTAKDRDGQAGFTSSTAIVALTVTSVNQHDPVFAPTTYTETVAEDVAVGYKVVQVVATDDDGDLLTYSIPGSTKFEVDADGWIIVKEALDYETDPHSIVFNVVATDSGSSPRSSSAAVTINVGDVNDNSALCSPSFIFLQKQENAAASVTTLTCSDSDSGSNQDLEYTIDSVNGVAGAGSFAVDANGDVTVPVLDYESDTVFDVVILVHDRGTPSTPTATVSLNVRVTDVNEHDPAISGPSPFSANVAESEAPGYSVLTVTATDADGSGKDFTYSLADTTYFHIDSNTGEITLRSQFDYETIKTYSVSVCVTDSGTVTAVRSACQSLSVTVTDANDNDPVFTPNVYSGNVDENKANGHTVLTVAATDADTLAAGNTITYSLVSGNTDNVFRVDSTGGAVIVDDNTFLDYERNTDFTLTVRAEDGGGRSADATVTITVNPLNEHTPTFTPSSSTVPLAEDAVQGSVITITAADSDSGSDGTLTYSISSGAAGTFAINPSTGEVSLVSSLDREATQQYTLEILAIDSGTNPSALTGTRTLTIDVQDVNDVTPSCTANVYTASVSEDAALSDLVKDISCSDGDLDPANLNNDLTYSIQSGDPGGLFAIDSAGRVTVATATFDRETTSSYTLTLHVVDKATTGKKTATITLSVDVTDVNDEVPVFTSDPYTPTVPENTAVGSTVETVVATDNDIGTNAALTYSLTSATPSGKFFVDPGTGAVTVIAALDYETDTSYTLVVTATDQGSPPKSQSTTVSVTVSDVDDLPPVCPSSQYTATMAEDAAAVLATGVTVSCPDADTASVQYSLTDALFAVHASTGVVSLTGSLDFETAQVHVLTVTASDGTRSDTAVVKVYVTDVNEHDPVFDPTIPYTATVPEDSSVGHTVKDVGAADSDASDTDLTFTISGGNVDNKFVMDSVSGVITLSGTLDREATPSYTLNLEVADGSGLGSRTATTSIVITITDVNDNDPTCTQTSYQGTVAEDSTAVLTLACSDVDTSTPTVRYTLQAAGNTGTAFGIDPNSGVLSVVGSTDYETLNFYTLSVEVDDQNGRTATVPVTVTVTPVNEAAPAFPGGGYGNTDVVESTAVGDVVLTVAATDTDTGELHGTVRYSIVAGNMLGDFTIDSSSGEIKVAKPLDREGATSSYTLKVRAADDVAGSADELWSEVDVDITITDTNDNMPVFNPTVYTTTILETAAVTGTVLTVTVSDADAGTNADLTLSIFSGNTGNAFSLSGSDLILDNPLDFETTQSYDLVIEAVDAGSPATLSSQARISIQVDAVNEEAPILTDTMVSDSIPEDTPLGTLIYTAVASDGDQGGNNDGTITYSIASGDSTNSFIIDSNSGELRVFSRLDYDTPPQTYTLALEATDGGGLKDTVTLTLSLTDVNDHTPQFSASSYVTPLDENVNTGHTVFTVVATDDDSGSNGDITFTITGGSGQGSFAVDGTTGEITTTAAIDYEASPILYLVVQAADGGSPSLSSSVLLRINVVDLNDNPPVLVPADYTVSWPEDVATGTVVASITATDADSSASNNNVVVFSLTSADFAVNSATGVITTLGPLDREANPSGHVLSVRATDQGTNPAQNTVDATVTVLLTDVNDNDPVDTATYDFTKSEDTAVGTILFQIVVTDADIGDNGRLTYSFDSGNTNNDLDIIGSNGMIQVGSNGLDRETTALYNLEILVADNGQPTGRSITVTATLTISDINDNDPVFVGIPYSFSVAENSVVGVLTGTIDATDADTGLNANLVYTIQTFWAGDSSHFVLDAATGEIDTAVTTLDRETRDTYFLWCRVHDQGTPQRHDDANVTITITDINDNPPIFSASTYTGTVAENSAVDTTVLIVTATDADIGINAAITFAIDTSIAAGTRAATFLKVGSSNGKILVKANIDYETDTSFTFEVTATDGGSPDFTATATVTVTVTDVNDNRPVFASTFINTEIAHGGQCGTDVEQLVCQDADSGLNAQVACYLEASQYDYLFAVNTSCALTTQTVASANFKYVVDVQCRDAGSPVLTAATAATVRVDTFIPDAVIAVFELGISRADFEAQQATFLLNLQAIVRVSYPAALVRLWCIQERGSGANPPVNVMVYALEDDSTESAANVGQGKTFLTSDELMAFFAADASGTPSSAVQGSAWDYYGIEKVREYTEDSTPWIRTVEGIVIVTVACVLFVILLCLFVYLCVRCYRKRKRPVTPIRAIMVEGKDQPLAGAAPADTRARPSWVHNKPGVPDIDQQKKQSVGPHGLSTAVIAARALEKYDKKAEEDSDDSTDRKTSVVSPRTVLVSTRSEEDTYPVTNREFDGRALDPNTGKVYEYNTKTHERRWLDSPPGYNV